MSTQSNIVPLKAGGGIAAIVPQSIDEAFRLANGIAISGLAPKGMEKPEQVMVAIMTGMEIGLPPMFAVQKIAVINGRPTIWGDAIPALLWGKGFKLREWMSGEGDKRIAHCEITRPAGDKTERSFSVASAKEAGLWSKAGPWKQYPDRMLQMRARGFAARDGAADVLGGLYLSEELYSADSELVDDAPHKRKSSAAAKRDGTNDVLQEIRRHIAGASDTEFLSTLADSYAQELADMPVRWSLIASQEFEDKWRDLGGDPSECPVVAPEEPG